MQDSKSESRGASGSGGSRPANGLLPCPAQSKRPEACFGSRSFISVHSHLSRKLPAESALPYAAASVFNDGLIFDIAYFSLPASPIRPATKADSPQMGLAGSSPATRFDIKVSSLSVGCFHDSLHVSAQSIRFLAITQAAILFPSGEGRRTRDSLLLSFSDGCFCGKPALWG